MTRRNKIALRATLVVALFAFLFYVLAAILLHRASHKALAKLAAAAEKQGVEIIYPRFRRARIAGPRTARWQDVQLTARFKRKESFDEQTLFNLDVGRLTIQWIGDGKARLVAEDVTVRKLTEPGEDEQPVNRDEPLEDRLESRQVRMRLPLSVLQPAQGLQELLPKVVDLIFDGEAPLGASAEGTLYFHLRGKPQQLEFAVDSKMGASRFSLDADDVRAVSDQFDDPLTDAEIEIVAANPMRAARLLRIKNEAERDSRSASKQNANVPEDAYRHVLWSYLLTKAFGEEFAKSVADAHEQGDTGNTDAQRNMDYKNNAVGRRYAAEQVERDQLLDRLLDDPQVARNP